MSVEVAQGPSQAKVCQRCGTNVSGQRRFRDPTTGGYYCAPCYAALTGASGDAPAMGTGTVDVAVNDGASTDAYGLADPEPYGLADEPAGYAPAAAGEPMYYYTSRGATAGPTTLADIAARAGYGEVGSDDVVWADGDAASTPAWQVPALAHLFHRPLDYSTPRQAGVSYAGFWKRVGAYIIDAIITAVANAVIGGVLGAILGATMGGSGAGGREIQGVAQLVGGLVGLALPWLYYTLFESSASRATPGKMALGIVVVDSRGQRIGFGRATGRYFGKILSAIILCIGFAMAGWTEKKQALHDLLADTLVINK